jgi:uncharacterized membrane protein YkgB
MSAQAAGRAANAASKAASKSVNEHVLNKGAKRDPELYVSFFAIRYIFILQSILGTVTHIVTLQVLLAVMSGAFGLAGFYFGTNLVFFHFFLS